MTTQPPPPSQLLQARAHAHTASYSALFTSPALPTPIPARVAALTDALFAHYLPGYTTYTLGAASAADRATTAGYLGLYFDGAAPLGLDVRVVGSRYEVLSASVDGGAGAGADGEVVGSVMCYLTWEIVPGDGEGDGWRWENLYGYRVRRAEGGGVEGGYEFGVADGEIQALLKHRPRFFG